MKRLIETVRLALIVVGFVLVIPTLSVLAALTETEEWE
jgi:hypothetical protein